MSQIKFGSGKFWVVRQLFWVSLPALIFNMAASSCLNVYWVDLELYFLEYMLLIPIFYMVFYPGNNRFNWSYKLNGICHLFCVYTVITRMYR